MQRHGRIDPATREKAYRDGGWSEFDEKSVPYTPADVARERALIRRAPRSDRECRTDAPRSADVLRFRRF